MSYYESQETGKQWTYVFLHGWMQDGTSFSELFELFEKQSIPFVSLDLPWFGSSPLIHDDMTIEEYGQTVQKIIEKLGLKDVILVGHSFGWRISIYLSSFYENIQKIILIWSAGIAPKINPLRLAIVKTGKVILSLPGLRKVGAKVKDKTSWADYKSAGKMLKIFKNTIANDLQHYMKKISLSTLMIWGEYDNQAPIEEAKIIHKHIKDSDLHIFEWTHFIHKEKPQEIMDLITQFK